MTVIGPEGDRRAAGFQPNRCFQEQVEPQLLDAAAGETMASRLKDVDAAGQPGPRIGASAVHPVIVEVELDLAHPLMSLVLPTAWRWA